MHKVVSDDNAVWKITLFFNAMVRGVNSGCFIMLKVIIGKICFQSSHLLFIKYHERRSYSTNNLTNLRTMI